MTGTSQIGFSQRIQLPWLEFTANMVLAGAGRAELTTCLQEQLKEQLSVGGSSARGNREKAISILLCIWLTGQARLPFLRESGLELLRVLPVRHHLPVHWGMTMAVYPFFGAVAETVGRLLRLQETVSAAQVLRRLKERYGERETVARAAKRILRVFTDWGVLADTETPGVYRQGTIHPSLDAPVVRWLLLACLTSGDNQTESLRSLAYHPSLFPFQVELPSPVLFEGLNGVSVTRHGFDQDILISLEYNQSHP